MKQIPTEGDMLVGFLKPIIDEIGLTRSMAAFDATKPIADNLTALFETVKVTRNIQLFEDSIRVLKSIIGLYDSLAKDDELDADVIE